MFMNMDDKIEISSESWNLKINHMDTLKNSNCKIQSVMVRIQHLSVTAYQKQQNRGEERGSIWERNARKMLTLTGV